MSADTHVEFVEHYLLVHNCNLVQRLCSKLADDIVDSKAYFAIYPQFTFDEPAYLRMVVRTMT